MMSPTEQQAKSRVPLLEHKMLSAAFDWEDWEDTPSAKAHAPNEWKFEHIPFLEVGPQYSLDLPGLERTRWLPASQVDQVSEDLDRALRQAFTTALLETAMKVLAQRYSEIKSTVEQLHERIATIESLVQQPSLPDGPANPKLYTSSEKRSLPSAEIFVHEHNLRSSVARIQETAEEIFSDNLTDIEIAVESDPDIGGTYLAIDIVVLQLSRDRSKHLQRQLYERLSMELTSQHLSQIVVGVTSHGSSPEKR